MLPIDSIPVMRRFNPAETVHRNDVFYFNFIRERQGSGNMNSFTFGYYRMAHRPFLRFMRRTGIDTRMPWGLARPTSDPETDSETEDEQVVPDATAVPPHPPPAPTAAPPARSRSPSPTPTEPVSPRSPPTEPAQAPLRHLGSPIPMQDHELIDLTHSQSPVTNPSFPVPTLRDPLHDFGSSGLEGMDWKTWVCSICHNSYPYFFNRAVAQAAAEGTELKFFFIRHVNPNHIERHEPSACNNYFCEECLMKHVEKSGNCPFRCETPLDEDNLMKLSVKVRPNMSILRRRTGEMGEGFDIRVWPPRDPDNPSGSRRTQP